MASALTYTEATLLRVTCCASACSYRKMLERAGYTPAKHLGHISNVQRKEGADSIKLGAVSGQQYKEIFNARAFDQYFFQTPPKKR